ncbi:MAG: HAD family hydrolase [bacterium]|nr:HAD family hydrolase [bacterium]
MSAVQAIVFDLDDTLYPEREFAFSGYAAVAAAFSERLNRPAAELSRRLGHLFDTPDRGRVFDVILGEAGVTAGSDELLSEMIAAFRNHKPTIHLHMDAEAALVRFAGLYRLGLISDGPLQMQRNKVEALALADRIDEIILTDEWGREFWKPHPRAFEELARRFNVEPGACLYVADNPSKDFVAPNALGWRTVFVKRPDAVYVDRAPPEGGQAQEVITTLDALTTV